jgi:hypothetical protein
VFLSHTSILSGDASASCQLYQAGRAAAFSFRAAPRKTKRSLVANVSTTMPPRRVRTVTAPCGQVPRNCAPTFWYAGRAARLSPGPSAVFAAAGALVVVRRVGTVAAEAVADALQVVGRAALDVGLGQPEVVAVEPLDVVGLGTKRSVPCLSRP